MSDFNLAKTIFDADKAKIKANKAAKMSKNSASTPKLAGDAAGKAGKPVKNAKTPPAAAGSRDQLDASSGSAHKARAKGKRDTDENENNISREEEHDHQALSGQAGASVDQELDELLDDLPADEISAGDEQDQLLLELQQDLLSPEEELGEAIHPKFAELINKLFAAHMSDDKAKNLNEKYLRPENCGNVISPKVNQEIWDLLEKEQKVNTKLSDISAAKVGTKIARSAVPFAQVVDLLYKARSEGQNADTSEIIKIVMEGLALLGSAMQELNFFRRAAIKRALPGVRKVANKVKEESSLLFGPDLQQNIKEVMEGEKLGTEFGKMARQKRQHSESQGGPSRKKPKNAHPMANPGVGFQNRQGSYYPYNYGYGQVMQRAYPQQGEGWWGNVQQAQMGYHQNLFSQNQFHRMGQQGYKRYPDNHQKNQFPKHNKNKK